MTRILTSENIGKPQESKIGGKAKNLFALSKLGLDVPSYFVLSADFFIEALHPFAEKIKTLLLDLDYRDPQAVTHTSKEICTWIEKIEWRAAQQEEIRTAYRRHFETTDFVAVRSSALGEDATAQSFAGQFESFLFVRDEEKLTQAIKKCWASAFSERALIYRHLNNLASHPIAIAVIVQKMIDGKISGVTFTADPISGTHDKIIINATYGLGEGIVSGRLDTDNFSVKKNSSGNYDLKIVQKTRQIVFDRERDHGTIETSVEETLQVAPSLTAQQVRELAELAQKIENYYGAPQDIEWTIADKIYLLQTRPITTLKPKGYRLIWDNSNIIESYSGVTTPLTYTFAREAYASVYRQFCAVCGVRAASIAENEETFENMIGLIKGRIYYNLKNWYRVLSLFPGYNYNKQFMEQMMGVKESFEEREEKLPLLWWEKYFVELPKLLGVGFRIAWHLLRSEKLVSHFQKYFFETMKAYRRRDLSTLEVNELIAVYDDLKQKLLWNWKAPIINDFFAMIFYGVLKKLGVQWAEDEAGTLQNDLLCGEGGVESTEPTKAIMRLALAVRADLTLTALFASKSPSALMASLRQEPAFDAFLSEIEDYLDKYGSRCMNELKLEEKTLKDDPSFLFMMISNYLRRPDLDIGAMEAREQAIRARAENIVKERLGFPKKQIFKWVVKKTRQHVKHRENLRFARTRIFGLVRELFNAIGQRFYEKKLLVDARDIYYLEVEEIFGIIRGTATSINLKALIQLRKEEFAVFSQGTPPPDRFETLGMVWHGNTFEAKSASQTQINAPKSEHILQGIGCCPGIVKARTKLVTSPHDATLHGEILVAERTDPGWVPLFPTASGILIERGSILSHSAIVARELGIPTIVGIKNLTQRVQNGQSVEMDGANGVVYLISPTETSKGKNHD
jgi:pyruvate,water dikinase